MFLCARVTIFIRAGIEFIRFSHFISELSLPFSVLVSSFFSYINFFYIDHKFSIGLSSDLFTSHFMCLISLPTLQRNSFILAL